MKIETLYPGTERTGGGLISTPADLVKWAKIIYEGNLVETSYLDKLLLNPDQNNSELYYGLGVTVETTLFGKSYGHNGWFPGYRTRLMYFPAYKTAIAVQVNTDVQVYTSELVEAQMTIIKKYIDIQE